MDAIASSITRLNRLAAPTSRRSPLSPDPVAEPPAGPVDRVDLVDAPAGPSQVRITGGSRDQVLLRLVGAIGPIHERVGSHDRPA
jgi:hypothetical protein